MNAARLSPHFGPSSPQGARTFTVFVTGPSGPAIEYDALAAAGHVVNLGAPLTEQTEPTPVSVLAAGARDAHIVVPAYRDRISLDVIAAAPHLLAIVVPFIGTDRIDVGAATARGILVCNSPRPENFVAVAEATIGLALVLLKRVKRNEARLRGGAWRHPADYGEILHGKTIGLVGLGRVGSQVARRLAGWDVRVLACDPYITGDCFSLVGACRVDLPTLLSESDVVSLHVVATPETRRMIGASELSLMKPTAVLINTARGEVVDEAAIAAAVRGQQLAGVALDTFETEPLPMTSELLALDPDRAILTPHAVGQSEASRRANLQMALDTIAALTAGQVPDCVVNVEALPHWKERFYADRR